MAEQKFEKVVDYSLNHDDFMGEDEILVTITLHEYRKLIKDCSVADHEKKRLVNEKALLATERKQLEEQNHELLQEVHRLQGIIAETTEPQLVTMEPAEQEETNGA